MYRQNPFYVSWFLFIPEQIQVQNHFNLFFYVLKFLPEVNSHKLLDAKRWMQNLNVNNSSVRSNSYKRLDMIKM